MMERAESKQKGKENESEKDTREWPVNHVHDPFRSHFSRPEKRYREEVGG